MKTRIIQIGNSQGIRIPKVMLEQSGLSEYVEIDVNKEQITIRPARKIRDGWFEEFKKMAAAGDAQLLDEENLGTQSSWDDTEWTW